MQISIFSKKSTILFLAGVFAFGCNSNTSGLESERNLFALVSVERNQQLEQANLASRRLIECETNVDNNSNFPRTSPVELCVPPAGVGRHFRFEGVGMTSNNGYLNLLIGYGTPTPASNSTFWPQATGFGGALTPTTVLDDGRWRIFMGKSSSCNRAWIVSRFSGDNGNANITTQYLFSTTAIPTPSFSLSTCPGGADQASGIHGPSTVCMDITGGTSGASPRITVWATGHNGANCQDLTTLTSSSRIYEKNDWASRVPTRSDRNFIYRDNDGTTLTRVVVRSQTAIQN